jgi:hypothetical protein
MEDELAPPRSPGEILADTARFWERRRIAYNVVLAVCVAAWFILTWPHFRGALTLPHLFNLLVLGLLANVCYTAGDAADFLIQLSSHRDLWRRVRWLVWASGTALAALFTNYWIADEIYPFVGR